MDYNAQFIVRNYYYSSWEKVYFYYEFRSNIYLYKLTFTYNVGVNEIMRFMSWNFTIWMHLQEHILLAMSGCTVLILLLEISFTLFFMSFWLLHISSLSSCAKMLAIISTCICDFFLHFSWLLLHFFFLSVHLLVSVMMCYLYVHMHTD